MQSIVNHRNGPTTGPVKPVLQFKYQPDQFQLHAFDAIHDGDHVLVTAHTGSGKTTVAEYATAYGIATGKRVIYTTPIKALSNQIYNDFTRKYPDWNVGIRTGDLDLRSEEAQVVIMTTEILQNMLYRKDSEESNGAGGESSALPDIDLQNVSVVIFDEVHYIKDRERGAVWERSIMMMPSHIQMVMLSATLPDADRFCRWIAECKQRNVSHTTTPHRAVPLTHYLLTAGGRKSGPVKVMIMDNYGKFYDNSYAKAAKDYSFVPSELDNYIKAINLPALFFCFSKKQCQQYAKQITTRTVNREESQNIGNVFEHLIRRFPNHKDLMSLRQTQEVHDLALKGICYHHAGLLPPLKEIIQELFSQGLINILFVTETFAAGVNMPAKTVVFTGFTKYDDHVAGFRPLLPEEYGQMSGRAGRRGMDTEGTVIHLPFDMDNWPDQQTMKNMMCGKIREIKSQIRVDYHHVFNTLLYGGSGSSGGVGGSLLDKENRERLTWCQAQLEETQQKLQLYYDQCERLKSSMPELQERMDYYLQYKEQKSLSKQQRKAYQKSGTEEWYQEHQPICDQYLESQRCLSHATAIEADLENECEELESGSAIELAQTVDFLHANDYLARGTEDLDGGEGEGEDGGMRGLGAADVTIKGIIAASINEANPILLTELIVGGYLDDLNLHQLLAVLAIFLPAKETDREIKLPDLAYQRIVTIRKYAEELSVAEWKFSPCISDWNVYLELTDMTYSWAQFGNIERVYADTGSSIQIGEFARMMIKLNNICKETLRGAQICHKDQLCMLLRTAQEALIKGVIFPQSLYVSPSSRKNG